MPNKKYSDFIEISPTFESVVDIDADTRNKNLWREYIVGEDMEKMMEVLCQSLNKEAPDSRRSFWIEGTYGTGKSYAAILIKHLMEEPPEVVDAFLAGNSRLAPYRNRFMKCRAKEKGDYLVIWKTGCTGIRDGNAMLMEAEKAVREALAAKFGDKADYGEGSLQDAVIRQVNSPVHNWKYILENTVLGDDYDSVDDLRKSLEAGDLFTLQKTAEVIRKYNWGLVDSLDTFKKWIAAVIESNGLAKSGIFFIWDEFTEYVANSDDQTILQQLSEFCKVQPFFMLYVVHRTTEMVERITPERYQLITHRFHQVEFHISTDAAFDLIAGSIKIRTGMSEHWKEERKSVIRNIKPFLPDMSGLDDKISEEIEHLCPMHPMTIKLLSRVAENYAASQRTMFRFMKDRSDTEHGFVGYINKEGPESQACWLTPEWLWDYFFTRESDFSDKDTKAAEYIRHYEESRHLVENDENAHRVFKTAMLLLALMSSAKGIYSGRKAKDGIAATKDCLETCLAGVMSKTQVDDMLQTMVDSKILVLDEGANNIVRIQLPFNGSDTDFSARLDANDKKYSRYMMFSKDGAFAQAFEESAWDKNDAGFRRMKIAVCCAETNSINTRLHEIENELYKYPYKLGLLIVTVKNEAQAVSVQSVLQAKAAEADEPRLTIALAKTPLTDEKRNKWLTAVTKQEMAAEAGQTGSVNQYRTEATLIVSSWVGSAVSGGAMIAYNGNNVSNTIYGCAHLQQFIRKNVRDVIFKYAPENIVVTNTAYKSCNEGAPMAGILRESNNSQLTNVLNSLKLAGILNLTSIEDIAAAKNGGSKQAECVAAAAELIKDKMESGKQVNLGDLWAELQREPYGYYNTIACGVLLGYIFSCYKNSKYTWTDSVQSPHVLAEATIGKMVSSMCGGKMTADYLSAGTVTWQNFSRYLSKIFNIPIGQLAEQSQGYHNVREAVTQSGTPFWVLKYLPKTQWSSEDHRKTADKIIDNIQTFITQEGDIEGAMDETLNLFTGRGKIREVLAKAFQDKHTMAAAFRSFLFEASPELKDVTTRLAIQPQELSDRLHSVMQDAIYTWTEEQVKDKLADVAEQYKYLEAIGKVQGTTYHSIEAAKKDLANLFSFLRIPMSAIAELNKPWFSALQVLYSAAYSDTARLSTDEREAAILTLERYGVLAKDCLQNGKPVLEDILNDRNIECTREELDAVYAGLRDLNCNTTLTQFNKELSAQINKISFARNKSELLETWRSITGEESVRKWCNTHNVPLMWIIPKDLTKAIGTLLDVQNGSYTVDAAVVSAINSLKNMDTRILTDQDCIEKAFMALVGSEYSLLWDEKRTDVITEAKIKIGNDMSTWTAADLTVLQRILKRMQQEKAKKEKLDGTKNNVRTMQDSVLRDMVTAFLDAHPEFCDEFSK
ncbi:MAG: DUF6079 family protein [Clostridiales bacterium]|nr:DUF6079 family protein [Clostridiales bacterium]